MSVFHIGERAVQQRAGVKDIADRVARSIRTGMPPAAQAFLADQPLLFLAARDHDGRVWADVLHGRPGFARALDDRTVRIDALPAPDGPLAAAPRRDDPHIGLLALEPATRRRMRINGLAERRDGGLYVRTCEVYSNCPKYIQRREPAPAAARAGTPVRRSDALTDADRATITAADTFVIATAQSEGAADASHRGGSPGFVQVLGDRSLRFGDYTGNSMFNTLGNLVSDPHAGLLFLDWERGDALHLSGRARVDWEPDAADAIPGAERVVEFRVDDVVARPALLPLRFALIERSRFNPPAIAPSLSPQPDGSLSCTK